jgi:hypothetical protein
MANKKAHIKNQEKLRTYLKKQDDLKPISKEDKRDRTGASTVKVGRVLFDR